MSILRFQPGDPRPGARRRNQVVDQLNRHTRPGASGEAEYGTAGITFHAGRETLLGLFELTGAMIYPDPGQSDPDEPTPYAEEAKAVWLNHVDNEYGGLDYSKETTLYHPAAFRNEGRVAIGHPPCASGQRCFAWYNRQSGRWEMLTPPLDVWRFELKDDVDPGQQATAYLLPWTGSDYQYQPDVEFEIYDTVGKFWGFGRAGSDPGTRGYAKYMPDSDRWEILQMPCGPRWFELTQNLFPGTSSVDAEDERGNAYTLYMKSQDPGAIARNLGIGRAGSGQYQVAGTQVWAVWNTRNSRWEITDGQFKLIAQGTTTGQIARGSSGTVSVYWLDYANQSSLTASGQSVTALNWQFPDIPGGAAVTIAYDRQEDAWMIISVDPSAGVQQQTVVTDVDFTEESFDSVQIELPWWSDIA